MKTGKNFKIGKYNVIHHTVVFGDDVTVGNFCEIGANCKIGNNVILQGYIRMAKGCVIEDDVTLKIGVILTSKVTMKKGSFMGPRSICLGSNHHRVTSHGTTIEDGAYIGAAAQIMPNLNIGPKVVVGALSLVKKHLVGEGAIFVGIPAEKLLFSGDCGVCPRCRVTVMSNETTMCPVSAICDKCSGEIKENKTKGVFETQCADCSRFFTHIDETADTFKCPHCGMTFTTSDYDNETDEDEIRKQLTIGD